MNRWWLTPILLAYAHASWPGGLSDALLDKVRGAVAIPASSVPVGDASIETGFSPEGSAAALVLKAINSAKSSIRLAAYSFTSADVVRALVAAKHRAVDVAVIVDRKSNLAEDRSGKARAALDMLVNADIPTRTIGAYPIHHDKFIVVDGLHTQTGSFNYSRAAARQNSENAIVIWNAPAIASQFIGHWQSRWDQGTAYASSY